MNDFVNNDVDFRLENFQANRNHSGELPKEFESPDLDKAVSRFNEQRIIE